MATALLLASLFSASFSQTAPAKPASPSANPAVNLPTLTTALAVHSLTRSEAARGYPVHLRAQVTYFDWDLERAHTIIFVHDRTASIFVSNFPASIPSMHAGMTIELWGISGLGQFGPVVLFRGIKVTGSAPLPRDAIPVNRTLLFSGAVDGQWVEVEAIVHWVSEYEHTVTLKLGLADGTVSAVMVREPGATYTNLIDARVRFHCNAAPIFNPGSQMIGSRLFCPGLSAVKIVEAAPRDPFQLPVTPINNLLDWNQVADLHHRVHLRGTVTLQWPGVSLCIRDGNRAICAQTIQTTHLAVGDVADVVGFSGVENSTYVLTDALFRKVAVGKPFVIKFTPAERALLGNHNSDLIRVEGQLIGRDLTSADTTLMLSSGKILFTAVLPQGMAGPESNAWKIGSVLSVTGICDVTFDPQLNVLKNGLARPTPKSLRVLMRTPDDVVVLKQPPWWTPRHALLVLVCALSGTLLVLAWVVVLRKRLEQQTHLLRKSEERFRHMALHDALTGLATRVLLDDRLNAAVETAKRHQTGLGLLVIDLDRFKEINDTFGHQGGDEVLRVTADRLMQAVRKSDTVARMGGDEFVVLLPDLNDPLMAEGIAAKIVKSLAVPIPYAASQVSVSVSIGVCTSADKEMDAEILLACADTALYQAKACGRNCFRIFTPGFLPAEQEAII
jgi:diguanylate cyclase (GGDEF)-like protein